jgi:hypothetical protein
MLQLEIEQISSGAVSDMPEIVLAAFDFLDGGQTTVREVASEKSLSFYAWGGNQIQYGALTLSSNSVATDLWLIFPTRQPAAILHAPSHVPSPPFSGAVIALLRVRDFGFSVSSPGQFAYGRRIGSHAYLDEV